MKHRIEATEISSDMMDQLKKLLRPEGGRLHLLAEHDNQKTPLPEPLTQLLCGLIGLLEQGHSVTLLADAKPLSSQQAADYLGVSRQHLVNLLEDGVIPYHKAGTHRRVKPEDLQAFSEQRDAERRGTLDALFDAVNEAGKYDSSYTGSKDAERA